MKKIFCVLSFLFLAVPFYAQAPASFKYQAVIRDTQGNPLFKKTVSLRISILMENSIGAVVYAETHQKATNEFGLVNLDIGKGTPNTGIFTAINWGVSTYFIKVECDPSGGKDYGLLGVSQLASVPYALYAEKSGNGFSGDYNDLTNKPDLLNYALKQDVFSGSYNDLTNKPDLFSSSYNDLTNKPDLSNYALKQDVFSGSYNDLTNKPNLFSGNYNDLTNKPDLSRYLTKEDAPPKTQRYNILLTGASFASPANQWFEIGCKFINANAINRADDGESIQTTAQRMEYGILYTKQELETLDALVIMQVHDQDVFTATGLKDDYTQYTNLTSLSYAAAFDYVIKRYITECYNLRNDPTSAYYNSKLGKPAVIILCTDWHDARVTYNTSVRKLAEKWGLILVEFDKSIGFTKNKVHPVTKAQYSLIYSEDTQTISGIMYGWHPKRGDDSFIQQKMAAIFADAMKRILPLR